MATRQEYDTVVIGGGQAGLADGYHLRGESRSVRDPRRRRPGRRRLAARGGTRCGSTPRAARRPCRACASRRARPRSRPRTRWPTTSRGTPSGSGCRCATEGVDGSPRAAGGTSSPRATGGSRPTTSSIATGAFQKPNVPAFASELDPRITQLHSREYRNLGPAAAGACTRGRREPLGRRHRLEAASGTR